MGAVVGSGAFFPAMKSGLLPKIYREVRCGATTALYVQEAPTIADGPSDLPVTVPANNHLDYPGDAQGTRQRKQFAVFNCDPVGMLYISNAVGKSPS